MKEEPDSKSDDMLPEYEFEHGTRGKYVDRFEKVAPQLMSAAATSDALAWIGRTMAALQTWEEYLVVCNTLMFDLDVKLAGQQVSEAMETPHKSAHQFWSRLEQSGLLRDDFRTRLRHLLAERDWVVHHSFAHFDHASPNTASRVIERLRKVSQEATQTKEEIEKALINRLKTEGMTAAEVKEKTKEVLEEWSGV
jgi:hypothetical protein